VGRTGVFLTLSIVLERIRYEGVVDVFQTVKLLRTQRPALVQTEVNNSFKLYFYIGVFCLGSISILLSFSIRIFKFI
jgi:netrin-G3 ligand